MKWLVRVGWAVAGLAYWLVVLVVALNWAIAAGPGGQPESLILALLAASAVTALLVGLVVLSQRRTRGVLTALAMVAAIVLVGTLTSQPSVMARNGLVPVWWSNTHGGCEPGPPWSDYLWPPDHWFGPNISRGDLCGP